MATTAYHKRPEANKTVPTPDAPEPDMLIDTSAMSEGQRQALEVAEAARSDWAMPSFMRNYMLGRFERERIAPFPSQNDEDKAVGDRLIDQVSKLMTDHLDAEEVDASRTIPAEVMDGLAKLGLFAMKVPRQYGGLGLSQVNYNRVMQCISSHCASTAVLVSAHQSIGVPQPLKMFGTEEQKQKYFPQFRDGAISAFALTEPGVGSDPAQMTTRAERSADGTHWVLNGEKLWCTNGPIADVMVVMARTPDKVVRGRSRQQITAFIVEADQPGVEVVHRCDFMGLRAINNGLLRFHDVKIPDEQVLLAEGKGLKLALATLNTGRLTLPAACAGVAKQCLNIARRWGCERVQWGQAIGEHEAGAAKLADIAATTFAMDAVTWLTSHWADNAANDIRLEAAMAKLFCSEQCWRLVDMTVQLRGGRGYERADSLAARGETPFPCERMLRDARINRIIEGTTEVMHLFLAREAMDAHLSRVGDLIRPHATMGQRAKGLWSAIKYYSLWYPRQWVNASYVRRHELMGPLADQARYLDRLSHRLARALFHAMALNGPKLERKQRLLARLMNIATEAFAMSATIGYAEYCWANHDADRSAVQLARTFCRQARLRIKATWREIADNNDRDDRRLAAAVRHGELTWLEEGIIATPGEDSDG